MPPSLISDRLLKADEVAELLGISRSTFYLNIREGDFPPGVLVGAKARRWRVSEVEAWVQSREEKSKKLSTPIRKTRGSH